MYTLAFYYMLKTPLEENPLLHNFVNGDDSYRNSRFKLIPYISKVSTKLAQETDTRIIHTSFVFLPITLLGLFS